MSGKPYRLEANADQSFIGSYVLGKGFVLQPEEARALIERDPRNKDVLFPYLNGEDLNSRADCSASRWVINFHGWSQEQAATYEDVFAIVERDVKPVRLTNNRKVYRDYWWQYAEKRPALVEAIADLEQVIVIARVSSTAAATLVPTGQVLHEKVVVFPTNALDHFSVLASNIHVAWAWKYSATMKADLQYAPSDCYETFPQPPRTPTLESLGESLLETRQGAMTTRTIGLTKLYNLVHSEPERADDIAAVREAHVEVDRSVAAAYGWHDLDLSHGFYETALGARFTIAPTVQTEILDRLLELNHTRYKEEQEVGLHAPGARKKAASKRQPKARVKPPDDDQLGFF